MKIKTKSKYLFKQVHMMSSFSLLTWLDDQFSARSESQLVISRIHTVIYSQTKAPLSHFRFARQVICLPANKTLTMLVQSLSWYETCWSIKFSGVKPVHTDLGLSLWTPRALSSIALVGSLTLWFQWSSEYLHQMWKWSIDFNKAPKQNTMWLGPFMAIKGRGYLLGSPRSLVPLPKFSLFSFLEVILWISPYEKRFLESHLRHCGTWNTFAAINSY